MSEPFIAEIKIFAGNFAPRGYSFCNGALLPISQNTALFSLIGTTFGGDGRTTTRLPNLLGRAPMHAGRGPGLTNRRLGETDGASTVVLSEQQMPNHNHGISAADEDGGGNNPEESVTAITERNQRLYRTAGGTRVNMSQSAIASEGGSAAHNNMEPYLGIHFIIALTGLYPSRN
jgi:microcystin-dependent protein